MLDTSIENLGFHMLLPAAQLEDLPEGRLPEGYLVRLFQDGDERNWARIETAVGEFSDEEDALAHFQVMFSAHEGQPQLRTLFVIDPDGTAVGTASAWWAWDRNGERLACLHWVATVPEAQGLGLGRTVVLEALSLLGELEPGLDVLLHTQTRSHVAVGLYHRLGFHMLRDDAFIRESRREGKRVRALSLGNAKEALRIMEPVLDPQLLLQLEESLR